MRWSSIGLTLSLAGTIGPHAGAAEPGAPSSPHRIVVMPVEAEGPGRASLPIDEVRATVRDTLHGRGRIEVLDPSITDAALAGSCKDVTCRRRLAETLDADFVVAPVLELGDGEFSAVMGIVARDPGVELGPFRQECPICSRAELERTVRAAAIDVLVAIVDAPAPAPPAVSPPPPPPSGPPRLTVAGLAATGAGAAATLGGIVLMTLHRRSVGCVEDPRFGECLPLRYTTLVPGGVVLGTGLAATAAGVAMLVIGLRKGGGSRRSLARAPRVTGTGLQWRF